MKEREWSVSVVSIDNRDYLDAKELIAYQKALMKSLKDDGMKDSNMYILLEELTRAYSAALKKKVKK